MQDNNRKRRKPPITVSRFDHERLSRLAQASSDRFPEAAEELLGELDRARISRSGTPPDVVSMGSTVVFKPDTGPEKTVTLVFPADADISSGKVSILTPIGTALLGLSPGQSMGWTARDGRHHELTVIAVTHSSEAEGGAPAGAEEARQ